MMPDANPDHQFSDYVVTFMLTRCASADINRAWTPSDFNIGGITYVRDLSSAPGARRIMYIGLDQNCEDNVVDVIHKMHLHNFVYFAGPSFYIHPD